MADLVAEGARTLTFVRSRRGAELTALGARARLDGHRPAVARHGGVLPGRIPRRGPPRAGTGAGRRRVARAGDHQRPGTRHRHRRAGRGAAGRVPRHRRVVLAAGRPLGPARPGRAGGADRPRRPAGHLPGAPSGGPAGQAGRAGGHRPGQPVRAGSAIALRGNGVAAGRSRGAALERRAGRQRPGRRRAAAPPRSGGTSRPPVWTRTPRWTSAGRPAARSPSSRPTPAGCWAAPRPARRRPPSTPARCTCTRARATWSTPSTSRTASRSSMPRIPGYSTFAREITDITVTGTGERVRLRTR